MRNGSETWRRVVQRNLARHTANYRSRFETPFIVNVRQPLWRRAVANTFSYTLSDSEYQQLIGTTALEYGRTLSHIFGWNYQLGRSASDLTAVDATLSWMRTDREVNDIDLNPQHLAVLRVCGNWLHRFVLNDAQGNVTLDAGISQGLPWLEADHDAPGISRDDAHGQFTKLDATMTFTLPLPKVGSAALAYRAQWVGSSPMWRCMAPRSFIWVGWTRFAASVQVSSWATEDCIRVTSLRG